MQIRRTLVRMAVLALGVGGLSLLAHAALSGNPSLAASKCQEGTASGSWILPEKPFGGSVSGTLLDKKGQKAFLLKAKLTANTSPFASVLSPVPGLSGKINGTITSIPKPSSQLATTPPQKQTFVVQGTYKGNALTGTGNFGAQIFKLSPLAIVPMQPVGKIGGAFSDPNGVLATSLASGKFKAEWVICE